MCSFGVAPPNLVVLPTNQMLSNDQPAAAIMDFIPMTNIMPFGMCISSSNPQVAAATTAVLGVLTPQPPANIAPWIPGTPTVPLGNMPCLDNTHTCMCM